VFADAIGIGSRQGRSRRRGR